MGVHCANGSATMEICSITKSPLAGQLVAVIVSVGPLMAMPVITGIAVSGPTLTITATNCPANGDFVMLQISIVALPLAQWTPILTNYFDVHRNLTFSHNLCILAILQSSI